MTTSLARVLLPREWRCWLIGFLALTLSACGGSGIGNLFSDSQPEDSALPTPSATGAKVALLLPLSSSEAKSVANALKQAAELALVDASGSGITFITKDTAGTTGGAQAAAQAALDEGAQLILGPLFEAEVRAVSPVARGRGVNVIAFSSVSSAAGSGTYLMSFLPEEEVAAVVRYAAANGYRNIAALYPQSQYGQTVQTALDRAAAAYGAKINAAQSYKRESGAIDEPVRSIGASVAETGSGQALFLPEGGELLRALGGKLQQNSVDSKTIKILGTGLWDDQIAPQVPIVQNGWYAGVAPDLQQGFESKYSSAYGGKPPRIASLAYDAAFLAINLAKTGGTFSSTAITNADGFKGQNGLFRFRQNGLIERGLSILEMTPQGPRVIAPAPSRFGAGS
jgi:ABC-type branched-subunit amino acid transport system substrate-binding protein